MYTAVLWYANGTRQYLEKMPRYLLIQSLYINIHRYQTRPDHDMQQRVKINCNPFNKHTMYLFFGKKSTQLPEFRVGKQNENAIQFKVQIWQNIIYLAHNFGETRNNFTLFCIVKQFFCFENLLQGPFINVVIHLGGERSAKR